MEESGQEEALLKRFTGLEVSICLIHGTDFTRYSGKVTKTAGRFLVFETQANANQAAYERLIPWSSVICIEKIVR